MLDAHTGNVYRLIKSAAATFKPIPTDKIPQPTRDADPGFPVERIPYVGGGLEIPRVDDDVPVRPWVVRQFMRFNNRFMPFRDRQEPWNSRAEGKAVVQQLFGSLIPPPAVAWPDPASDEALVRWCFQGFVAQRLERGYVAALEGAIDGPADGFVVRLEFMRKYAVRPGLALYGGDAWFSAEGKPLGIRIGDRFISPGDGHDWEVAKFTFRSSGLVWVTLADHVGRCHYGVSNALLLATRRLLPLDHPLRSFVTPLLFRTAAINSGSTLSLLPWGALLHRTSGFTWESMLHVYNDAVTDYRFESFPDELRRKGVHPASLPTGSNDIYPWATDGLAYWGRVAAFMDEAFANSQGVRDSVGPWRVKTLAWWRELGRLLHISLPELSEEALRAFLTYAMFTVSAFHEQVGTVAAYVTDPTFTSGKIWPGRTMADRQSTLQLCVVACITGFPMPTVGGDFSHLMPDEGTRHAARHFRQSLASLAAEIATRNAVRPQPLLTFNPESMKLSVSI